MQFWFRRGYPAWFEMNLLYVFVDRNPILFDVPVGQPNKPSSFREDWEDNRIIDFNASLNCRTGLPSPTVPLKFTVLSVVQYRYPVASRRKAGSCQTVLDAP